MAVNGTKSPHKEANRLSTMLRMALGEDRFPIDVPQLALEVSKNNEDPIEKVFGGYRGRERFTAAHEVGHYMLHRPKLGRVD